MSLPWERKMNTPARTVSGRGTSDGVSSLYCKYCKTPNYLKSDADLAKALRCKNCGMVLKMNESPLDIGNQGKYVGDIKNA